MCLPISHSTLCFGCSVGAFHFIYLPIFSFPSMRCAPRRQAPALILVWLPHSVAQGLGSAGHTEAKSDLSSVPTAIQLAGSLVRQCLKLLLPTKKGHLPTPPKWFQSQVWKSGRLYSLEITVRCLCSWKYCDSP